MDGVKNIFGFGKKDQQPIGEDSSSSSESSTSASTSISTSTSSSTTETPAPTKSSVSIPIKYTLEKQGIAQLTDDQLAKIKKRLQAFDTSDRSRLAREEIFNRLEALTYKVRSRLEDDAFVAASTPVERSTLDTMIDEVSDWLYSAEGSGSSYDQIKKKLAALETPVNAIEKRIVEAEKRPKLVEVMKETLKSSEDFVLNIRTKITEYEAYQAEAAKAEADKTASTAEAEFDGLEDEDESREPVEDLAPAAPLYSLEDLAETETLVESITSWLEEMEASQKKLSIHDDAVLTVKDLEAKTEQLQRAGSDLAMKAVRGMERKKAEKAAKAEKAEKARKAKAKKAKAEAKAKTEADSEAKSEADSQSTSTTPPASGETVVEEVVDEVQHEEL